MVLSSDKQEFKIAVQEWTPSTVRRVAARVAWMLDSQPESRAPEKQSSVVEGSRSRPRSVSKVQPQTQSWDWEGLWTNRPQWELGLLGGVGLGATYHGVMGVKAGLQLSDWLALTTGWRWNLPTCSAQGCWQSHVAGLEAVYRKRWSSRWMTGWYVGGRRGVHVLDPAEEVFAMANTGERELEEEEMEGHKTTVRTPPRQHRDLWSGYLGATGGWLVHDQLWLHASLELGASWVAPVETGADAWRASWHLESAVELRWVF